MNLVERLEEAFENRVGETAMLPASDVLSAIIEIQRLQAELAECKRDAERYRFLRVVGDEYEHMRIFDSCGHLDPEFLDEAIDSAIAAQKGEVK